MRARTWIAALSVLTIATSAAASDRRAVREQAESALDALRAAGEPKDRCSLGVVVQDGPVLVRADGHPDLRNGDRLIRLDGQSVEGGKSTAVLALLRNRSPADRVTLMLDRDGDLIDVDVDVKCVNGRGITEPLMEVLEHASRGRFDDCVEAVNAMVDVGASETFLRFSCAVVSRRAERYNLSLFAQQAAVALIEEAHHAAAIRESAVALLQRLEGTIGNEGVFNTLVSKTRAWPGGEALFDSSTPDWALFRRNGEAAIRSKLIDPESARFEWTHGFLNGSWKPFLSRAIEGYWTCGRINARNRMGGYAGSTVFVVVLSPQGSVLYSELGESRDLDVLGSACANSVRLLPPPPSAMFVDASRDDRSPSASGSIADEIAKLAQLRDSGVLSEEEFQTAKDRLLKGR